MQTLGMEPWKRIGGGVVMVMDGVLNLGNKRNLSLSSST